MHRLDIGLDLSHYQYTHQHRIKSFLCIFFLWPPCLDAWLVYSYIKRELQSRRGCDRREKMTVKTFKNPNWQVATKIFFLPRRSFHVPILRFKTKVGKIVLPDNIQVIELIAKLKRRFYFTITLTYMYPCKKNPNKYIKKWFATLMGKITHSFGSFSWHQIVGLMTKVRHISSNQMPQTASNWKSLSDLGIIG